ncbi:MAG TPA: hypothetical protein VLA74_11325 [Nitrososphaeraceae archaeon]|nr:hypothetical protein [Nitrososphaeraceae archaeon]
MSNLSYYEEIDNFIKNSNDEKEENTSFLNEKKTKLDQLISFFNEKNFKLSSGDIKRTIFLIDDVIESSDQLMLIIIT